MSLHADARLYAGLFDGAEEAEVKINADRKAYVHLIRGELTVNGQALKEGDAALIKDESLIQLSQGKNAEVLVFDLQP